MRHKRWLSLRNRTFFPALVICAAFFASCDTLEWPAFIVTFNANGGSGTVPPQTVEARSPTSLPDGNELSRIGFVFDGWNTRADGTGINHGAGTLFTPTDSVTLFAEWAAAVTVTFDANHGVGDPPAPLTIATGSSMTLPGGGELSKAGFVFDGWNTRADGTGINHGAGTLFTPTDSVTLFARWTAVFTVTFDANYGTGTMPDPRTVAVGSSIILPGGNQLSRGEFVFNGWNTKADGTGYNRSAGTTYTPTGSITLFARWVGTVTFDANGGIGTVPDPQIVNAGSGINLPGDNQLSRGEFVFDGWNTRADGTGDNFPASAEFTPSGNIALFARWIATVTFDANGGIGTVPDPRIVNAGSGITLPDAGGLSLDGFVFSGWNTMADGTGYNYSAGATYIPTGKVTLFARWLGTRTISIGLRDFVDNAPGPIQVPDISYLALRFEGATIVITVDEPERFGGTVRWFVDGNPAHWSTVSNNGAALTLGYAQINRIGPHRVTVEVTIGGKPYSRAIAFTVVP